jgi:hypothetical protein
MNTVAESLFATCRRSGLLLAELVSSAGNGWLALTFCRVLTRNVDCAGGLIRLMQKPSHMVATLADYET